jgi:diguanylate cyclase (GGDEF)-like protein/PAS domain S-box-containing protein
MPTDRNRAFRILLACTGALSLGGFLGLEQHEKAASADHFQALASDRVRALERAIARPAALTGAIARVIARDGGRTEAVPDLLEAAPAKDVAVLWAAWDGAGEPRAQRFGVPAAEHPAWLHDALERATRARGTITIPAAATGEGELLTFARRVPDAGPQLGVVLVAARIGEMVDRAIEGMQPAAIELTLEDDALGGRRLYPQPPRAARTGALTQDFPLRFADRSWTVRAAATAGFGGSAWGWAGRLTLASGLLCALLAAGLARAAHRDTEQEFALAQESVSMGIWDWDIARGRTTASASVFRLFGLSPQSQFPDRDAWLKLVHPDDRDHVRRNLAAALAGGSAYEHEYRVIPAGGETRWLLTKGTVIRDQAGHPIRLLGVNIDITALKEAEVALSGNQERMRRMFANAAVGVLMTDVEGRIVEINDFACRSTGYSREELLALRTRDVIHPDDVERHVQRFRALISGLATDYVAEVKVLRKDGTTLRLRVSASAAMEDGRCSGMLALCEDITARHAAEEKLQYQTLNDTLTGLPNRRLFDDRTQQAVSDARRTGSRLAVFCLEIDGFHRINGSLEPSAADRLLVEISTRLRCCLRASDTLARLGGDQFGVLAPHFEEAADAEQVGQKLIDAMAPPFDAGGQEIALMARVGISLYPRHGTNAAELIRDAQAALHSGARDERNRVSFFTPELGRALRERMELEGQLRGASSRGEIVVHYQPEYDLRSGLLVGFEALARWKHPELGLVAPARFIPLAEETGLIVPIGMAVLEQACREGLRWQKPGSPPVQVAVNVSSIQFFRDDFVEAILDVLKRSGLPPELLQLELTESVLVTGFAGPAAKMAQLRERGVTLVVDDFGTGYSSLSYLPRLPFQGMKIDRSFVRNLHELADSRAMIQSLVSLAHNLNLNVVVEGVESPQELAVVRALGCDTGQGYLLGRPSASTARHLEGERRLLLPSESLTYS